MLTIQINKQLPTQHTLYIVSDFITCNTEPLFLLIQKLQRNIYNHIYHIRAAYKDISTLSSILLENYLIFFQKIFLVSYYNSEESKNRLLELNILLQNKYYHPIIVEKEIKTMIFTKEKWVVQGSNL